jgi:hypothetical protein
MFESDVPLSVAGEARREEILRLAKGEARRRRRRRAGVRVGAVCAVLGLGVVVMIWPGGKATEVVVKVLPTKAPEPAAGLRITFIQTDPTIADRLAVSPARSWTVMDDDQLLRSMADAGHPAGLISMNGQTFLLPR